MIVDYNFPRLRTRGTLYVCSLARTRTMYILNSVAFVKALTAYHDHDLHVELCSSVACVRSLVIDGKLLLSFYISRLFQRKPGFN